MYKTKHIILRLLLVLLPVLMATAQAMAQNVVFAGQTTELSTVQVAGDTYLWELYDDASNVNFATIPGNCPITKAFFVGNINTGPIVNVSWLSPGIYFFKVTASRAGCTKNLKVGKVTVMESAAYATILQPTPICKGESTSLNITLTGDAPWEIDIFDGNVTTTYDSINSSPFILNIMPLTSTVYTVTRVTDATTTNTMPSNSVTVTVKPKPIGSHIYQYNPTSKKK